MDNFSFRFRKTWLLSCGLNPINNDRAMLMFCELISFHNRAIIGHSNVSHVGAFGIKFVEKIQTFPFQYQSQDN